MDLSVRQVVAKVFAYCWQERATMVRYGAVPLAIVVAASLVAAAVVGDATANEIAGAVVVALIQAVAYLPVTVTWYRIVVDGEGATRSRPLFALGRVEGRVLWWQALLLLAALGLSAVAAAIIYALLKALEAVAGEAGAYAVAGILAVLYVAWLLIALVRLSMVMVLAAMDRPVSFGTAWRLTDGLGTKLFYAIGAIGLVAGLAQLPVSLIGMTIGGSAGSALAIVGESVIALVVFLAVATVFGFVYRDLSGGARVPAAAAV